MKKILKTIGCCLLLTIAAALHGEFIQIQQTKQFYTFFSAVKEEFPHLCAILINKSKYNPSSGTTQQSPVYFVRHNQLQSYSFYAEMKKKLAEQKADLNELKVRAKAYNIKRIVEFPAEQINPFPEDDICIIRRKFALSGTDLKQHAVELSYAAQIIVAFDIKTGRYTELYAEGFIPGVAAMAELEIEAVELCKYLKTHAAELPQCPADNTPCLAPGEKAPPIQHNPRMSPKAKAEKEDEYFWYPPLGIFRGAATAAMSPLNYFRSFALADSIVNGKSSNSETAKQKAQGNILEYIVMYPFAFFVETFPVIGDVFLGAFDMVTLGISGNLIYGSRYTPWFWERSNQGPFLTQ